MIDICICRRAKYLVCHLLDHQAKVDWMASWVVSVLRSMRLQLPPRMPLPEPLLYHCPC